MSDALLFADCRDCACLAARRSAQRLTREYESHLRPHGLTINQFSMLAHLILAGSTPVSRLAEMLGVDRTTMTRNVDLSAARGLIRENRGKDARERLIEITEAGRETARQALPAWRKAQEAREHEN